MGSKTFIHGERKNSKTWLKNLRLHLDQVTKVKITSDDQIDIVTGGREVPRRQSHLQTRGDISQTQHMCLPQNDCPGPLKISKLMKHQGRGRSGLN